MEPSEALAWVSEYISLFYIQNYWATFKKEHPLCHHSFWLELAVLAEAPTQRMGEFWMWAQWSGGQEGWGLQQGRKEIKLKNVLLSWHSIFTRVFWNESQDCPSSLLLVMEEVNCRFPSPTRTVSLWWLIVLCFQLHDEENWAALPGIPWEILEQKTEIKPWKKTGCWALVSSYRGSRGLLRSHLHNRTATKGLMDLQGHPSPWTFSQKIFILIKEKNQFSYTVTVNQV